MDGADDFFDRTRKATAFLIPVILIVVGVWQHFHPPRPISKSLANGVYRNHCCENVVLSDGTMYFGGHSVNYRLFTMKNKLYAEPDAEVIVLDGKKMVVGRDRNNLSIRFLRPAHRKEKMTGLYDASTEPPAKLTLFGYGLDTEYEFERVSADVR